MVVKTENRSLIMALLLHVGIRIRYVLHSVFGLQPFFTQIAAYPSKWRPKNCPKYDTFTCLSFNFIWLFIGFARDYTLFYYIYCKLGIIYCKLPYQSSHESCPMLLQHPLALLAVYRLLF